MDSHPRKFIDHLLNGQIHGWSSVRRSQARDCVGLPLVCSGFASRGRVELRAAFSHLSRTELAGERLGQFQERHFPR